LLFLREALGHVRAPGRWDWRRSRSSRSRLAPLTLIGRIAASSAVFIAVAIADTVRECDQAPNRSA
jgi:hypothetical protein